MRTRCTRSLIFSKLRKINFCLKIEFVPKFLNQFQIAKKSRYWQKSVDKTTSEISNKKIPVTWTIRIIEAIPYDILFLTSIRWCVTYFSTLNKLLPDPKTTEFQRSDKRFTFSSSTFFHHNNMPTCQPSRIANLFLSKITGYFRKKTKKEEIKWEKMAVNFDSR